MTDRKNYLHTQRISKFVKIFAFTHIGRRFTLDRLTLLIALEQAIIGLFTDQKNFHPFPRMNSIYEHNNLLIDSIIQHLNSEILTNVRR